MRHKSFDASRQTVVGQYIRRCDSRQREKQSGGESRSILAACTVEQEWPFATGDCTEGRPVGLFARFQEVLVHPGVSGMASLGFHSDGCRIDVKDRVRDHADAAALEDWCGPVSSLRIGTEVNDCSHPDSVQLVDAGGCETVK